MVRNCQECRALELGSERVAFLEQEVEELKDKIRELELELEGACPICETTMVPAGKFCRGCGHEE